MHFVEQNLLVCIFIQPFAQHRWLSLLFKFNAVCCVVDTGLLHQIISITVNH
jgi:hypothetical protein